MSDAEQKTEADLRLYSNRYNAGTKRHQLVFEEVNSAENRHVIVKAFKDGRARDIADEPKVDKTPCFVLGSGASLDDTLPKLKGWEGGIFCSTSQARTLMYHGIEPTHIVCLDPFSLWDEIAGVDWSKTRTKLILQPGVFPDLVENWPNEMLLYILDNGKPDSFYATTMKRQYTWREGPTRNPTFHYYIRTAITIFACSPPMQMFVADKLGYGTVFLTGFNWSEYKGKRRSTEYTVKPISAGYKCPHCDYVVDNDDTLLAYTICPSCGRYPEKIEWATHENPYVETGAMANGEVVISNNGRKTRPIHLYYKKNLISAWRLSHQTMYNTDEEGILTEVPYTNISKVMMKKGLNYPAQSHAMIDRITERYLASVGAFVIVTDKGVAFVESDNPDVELREFMKKVGDRYLCDKCGSEAIAEDGNEHVGDSCPGCKDGKLKKAVEIDVEANMKRIHAEIALAKVRAAQ